MASEIKKLITKNHIVSTIVSIMIATRVDDLVDSFTKCFCLPFLNIDLNRDGKPDIDQLKKFNIQIGSNVNIKPGLFFIEVFKFFITFIIIYSVLTFILKY